MIYMGVSKVNYGGKPLIDLMSDTVTSDTLLKGVTAHDKSGEMITGTKEFNTQVKSVIPTTSSQDVIPDSGYDGLSQVTVSSIPEQYVDTSGCTADEWDIFSGKTAYVNGRWVSGWYGYRSNQINSGSTNCSSTKLVISGIEFEPSAFCLIYNSSAFTNNRVIALYVMPDLNVLVAYSKTSSGIAKSQINLSNIYNASSNTVTIPSPSSTYVFHNANYRYFVFR